MRIFVQDQVEDSRLIAEGIRKSNRRQTVDIPRITFEHNVEIGRKDD